MTKAKAKSKIAPAKRGSTSARSRKPVDLQDVRQQISNLVGSEAVSMVQTTIDEVDKGHYGAMKYLFELVGLFPAIEAEVTAGEDVLAKTLLKRLGLPEDAEPQPAVTKESGAAEGGKHPVE